MAINLTEDINHSGGGKIVSVAQSAGSWQTIATKGDFDNFTSDTTTKQNLTNGQFFDVLDESQLYKLTVAGFGPFATYTLGSASFGGGSTPDGTVSGSQQISDFGFVSSDATSSFTLVSDFNDITSSLSTFVVYSASNATTASYISDTFISASAARSGFGTGGSGVGGIFTQTGSFYSTTNDLEITGSVTIGDGLLKFKEYDSLPSVEGGTIAYYDGVFWLGQDN